MKIAGYEVERVAAGHYRIASPEGPLVITYFHLYRRWGIEGPHKAEYSDGFRTLTEAVRFAYRHLVKSMLTKFDKCEHCCERGETVSDRGMRNVNVILMCDACWGIQEDALGDWVTDPGNHVEQMRGIEESRRRGEDDQRAGELSMRDLYIAPADSPRLHSWFPDEWVRGVDADELTRMAREDGLL